ALPRLAHDRLHHRFQIARFAIPRELAVGARTVPQNVTDVVDLAPAVELVDDVVDELEQLQRQVAHRNLLPSAEVDQLPVETPARRPPFVLLEEAPVIEAEAEIPPPKLVQLDDHRLRERRNRALRAL